MPILTADSLEEFGELCEEYVPSEAVLSKLRRGQSIRVYCGYEMSGGLHVGHLRGIAVLNTFARYSNCRVIALIADLHVWLNKRSEGSSKARRDLIASLKKVLHPDVRVVTAAMGSTPEGLDNFQLSRDYVKTLMSLSTLPTINRVTRGIATSLRACKDAIRVSDVLYPLMQVADMYHLHIDVAIGGIDQRKIHMLARDLAVKFGVEKPAILHVALMCTGGTKISKSAGNGIGVLDSPDQIREKVAKCPGQLLRHLADLLNCAPVRAIVAKKLQILDHRALGLHVKIDAANAGGESPGVCEPQPVRSTTGE